MNLVKYNMDEPSNWNIEPKRHTIWLYYKIYYKRNAAKQMYVIYRCGCIVKIFLFETDFQKVRTVIHS